MIYKSHSEEAIMHALRGGESVWILDTANDGDDDVLIGSYENVMFDILNHHELNSFPRHWKLLALELE